jgi:pimeloyl-ACP methyl ester carboxylesterase
MTNFWNWENHRVSWQIEGNNDDSPISIVLIHGFGASKDHWRYNQKILGKLCPCYAIDLIGFGESSQPNSQLLYEKQQEKSFSYCFDNWGQQITSFCDEIVQKPVFLIGNSIGAIIALKASENLAHGCAGAVLINCAQRTMDDKRLFEKSLFMRFIRPIIKTLVRQKFLSSRIFKNAAKPIVIEKILKLAYPSGQNINQELIDLLYEPTKRPGSPEAFRGFINLFDDYLAPDLLKNMKIPVYLIWGEEDPWEPVEEAQKWFKNIECIKSLDLISKAGHCPHDEMPEKVNPVIEKIIQDAI